MNVFSVDKLGSTIQNVMKILFMMLNVFMSSRWFMETYTNKSHFFAMGVLGSLVLGILSKSQQM